MHKFFAAGKLNHRGSEVHLEPLCSCFEIILHQNAFPARRRWNSWDAPSSVNPGDLPAHVHAGGEPRAIDGELDSQPDGLDHGLNPLELSNHST